MDRLMTECHIEAHKCNRADAYAIRLTGTSMACGHCDEVVYPEFSVIRHHTFSCDAYGTATWYSSDLEAVVHRCNQPSELVDVSRFLDVAASSSV